MHLSSHQCVPHVHLYYLHLIAHLIDNWYLHGVLKITEVWNVSSLVEVYIYFGATCHHAPPKHLQAFTRLEVVTYKNVVVFIVTALGTASPLWNSLLYSFLPVSLYFHCHRQDMIPDSAGLGLWYEVEGTKLVWAILKPICKWQSSAHFVFHLDVKRSYEQ
jgi:hypothetical protein